MSALEPTLADLSEQGSAVQGLIRTLDEGTFVHAYLISGPAGLGKRTLARLVTQRLLCTGGTKPCGVCPACVQVRQGVHPDTVTLRVGQPISPDEKPKKSIPVGDIRELVRICGQNTYEGGLRVAVIEQADQLTPQAENALLKTLEEPYPGNIFLLLTDSPSSLLSTIVSRCRHIRLHPYPDSVIRRILTAHHVPEDRIQQVLPVCGGSPGQAITIASDEAYWSRRSEIMKDFFDIAQRSDILRISTKYKDQTENAGQLLDDIEFMIHLLLQARLGQVPPQAVQSFPTAWQSMASRAEISSFVALLDAAAEARRLRTNQVTWQASAERLLLRLMEEKSQWLT